MNAAAPAYVPLTDVEWKAVEHVFSTYVYQRGAPSRFSDRVCLDAILHAMTVGWLYANQARAAINKPWQLIKRDGARGRGGVITTPPRGGFQFTVAAAGNRNAMRRLRSGRAVLTRPRRTRPADAVEFVISHVVVPLWRDSVSRSASE
ncbi:hypothetical protein [Burkholderia pseudomallei]|uniref:hypothetical protein n=1 Tax=Burkholderia pseudomallei TaxID=28450 RepID=UPI000A4E480D|nr:hypothetical protein [Burkholderia pseudomallei]